MKVWTTPAPPGVGPRRYSIGSVSIRQTFGPDEQVAAKFAEAKAGGTDMIAEELMRASIVKVDGELVSVPFTDFDSWNLLTRKFVWTEWSKVNGIGVEEITNYAATAIAHVSGGWQFTVGAVPKGIRGICEIGHVVAKELIGTAENEAVRLAKAEGRDLDDARVLAGIVSVDDKPISPEAFGKLSSRARRFIVEAFRQVNGVGDAAENPPVGAVEEEVDITTGASSDESDSELG